MGLKTIPHTTLASLIIIAHLLTTDVPKCNGAKPAKFPAIFVFGDSTVDTGNNNYRLTLARSDHAPYGMGFPGRVPTGRFSDGKLVPDILASLIGLKDVVPHFLNPNLTQQDILTGVNFASAGAGLDKLTTVITQGLTMPEQLEYLKDYKVRLVTIAGHDEAARILSQALVLVSVASNDFIFNFYDFKMRTPFNTIDKYQDFVLDKLLDFLKGLYNFGCRRILTAGIPPVGCLPVQKKLHSDDRHCVEQENNDTHTYNDKLVKLLRRIEPELPGSNFLYINLYDSLMDIIEHPMKYGLEQSARGCCGGDLEFGPFCRNSTSVCADPSKYVFFDGMHPTETVYTILSNQIAQYLLPKFM